MTVKQIRSITFLVLIIHMTLLWTCEAQLKFMVIGDWGGSTSKKPVTDIQSDVAAAMGQVAQDIQSQFVVSVGDNFYDTGVTSVDDPRWNITFEQVYTHPALQTRWYVVAGNRDYYGNVDAEIQYTTKSPRWYFPAPTYDNVFSIPNSNATVHMIFLDTWDLTSQSHPVTNPPDLAKAQKDLAFLDTTLRNSKSTWKFVVTHYPLWSAGAHGPTDNELVNSLEPILTEHKVDLYLCGHDHSEQHLVVNGINYFVVGGGSEATSNWAGFDGLPTGTVRFQYPMPGTNRGGFGAVIVTESNVTVQLWNSKQNLKYAYTVLPSSQRQPPTPTVPVNPDNDGTNVAATTPNNSALIGGIIAAIVVVIIIVVVVIVYYTLSKRKVDENSYVREY